MAGECTFCSIVAGEVPAEIVHDRDRVVGFLDSRPLFPGHTLLVPRSHHETIEDLPAELIEPLFSDARRVARAVREATGSEGTFVAMNNRVSQSVPHLHVHVVPRVKGDGLRGFFWPRRGYADEEEMRATAAGIRERLG